MNIYELQKQSEPVGSVRPRREHAVAKQKLQIHYANNFIKALEEIKRLRDILERESGASDLKTELIIKELEEVK
jgi:hypothetical protein